MKIENVISEESLEDYLRKVMPGLPAYARDTETLRLQHEIGEILARSAAYWTTKMEIRHSIAELACALHIPEEVFPGTGHPAYRNFLLVIRQFLHPCAPGDPYILRDTLCHAQSLLLNLELFVCYLVGRRNLARRFFGLDREDDVAAFPEEVCEGAVDLCYLRHPDFEEYHAFYGGCLLEKLMSTMEYASDADEKRVLDIFKAEVPKWIENVRRVETSRLPVRFYDVLVFGFRKDLSTCPPKTGPTTMRVDG